MEILFYIFLSVVGIYFIWGIIDVNILHPEKGEKLRESNNKPNFKTTDDGKVICPNCGSTQIQLMKRGWKLTTGLLGSSKNERICINCKNKF